MNILDLFLLTLIFIMVLFSATFVRHLASSDVFPSSFCDYDSCSQESDYWDVQKKCFNNSDPECKDFLLLWNACQRYKQRIGVC